MTITSLTTTIQPSRRKALNKDQLNVLYALYKFRFGTTDLLKTTQSKNISRQYMNTRLRILCEQEYIGRRYDSSYRLQAKFATYYLLPKGIEVLKQHPEHFNKQVLRNIKRDVDAGEAFVSHSLTVFALCTKLKELYGKASGNGFYFYTKSYMAGDRAEGFPKVLPDTFASFNANESSQTKHYLIDCYDSTMPQSAMKKRIVRFIDHADRDEWTLTEKYPNILFICETERIQKNVKRWVRQELSKSWVDNLRFEVLTSDTLQNLNRHSD